MATTATEKLERIKEYVENMHPVYRTAILVSEDQRAKNEAYDRAVFEVQQDLLRILDD